MMELSEQFIEHEFTIGAGGTCYRCRKPIDKGGRYSRTWHNYDPGSESVDGTITEHFHPWCILEVAPQALRDVLGEFGGKFPERARLKAALAAKLARMATPRKKKGAPARGKKTAMIQPERDSQGRPRVRVLVAASDDDTYPLREFFQAHSDPSTRLMRVASKKREYTFLIFHGSNEPSDALGPWAVSIEEAEPWHACQDDPAMPVLGGIVMSLYRGEGFNLLSPTLSTWRAFGLPVPLLWFPEGDTKLQEQGEADGRRRLEQGGFDGARAPVLVTKKVDRKSLAQLAARLDTYLPDSVDNRDGRSLLRRRLDTLQELVAEGRLVGAKPILEWLKDRRRYDDPPLKLSEATLEAVARCAVHKDVTSAALNVLEATQQPILKDAARAAAIEALNEPSLNWSALNLLKGDDDLALTKAAINALTTLDDYRASQLRTFLRGTKHPKKLAMIRELLAALPRGTKERRRLEDYLATSKPKKT